MKKCTYCGRESSDDAAHCGECGTVFIEAADLPKKMTSAGFGIRVVARIIDTVFETFVGFCVGICAGVILPILKYAGILSPGWQHRLHGLSLASFLFGLASTILYHFLCEGICGATVGKLTCGICVVNENGGPCSMKGALIRSLAYYFDSAFFGLVGYESMRKSSYNQRFGDKWCKTAVFKLKEISGESCWTPARLIIGLASGTAAFGIIIGLSLIIKAW